MLLKHYLQISIIHPVFLNAFINMGIKTCNNIAATQITKACWHCWNAKIYLQTRTSTHVHPHCLLECMHKHGHTYIPRFSITCGEYKLICDIVFIYMYIVCLCMCCWCGLFYCWHTSIFKIERMENSNILLRIVYRKEDVLFLLITSFTLYGNTQRIH